MRDAVAATPSTELVRVAATRYVVPLREGGSLPGIVEADDDGTYVLKFRGAGQGVKVLVAEIVVGELARALGIPVPRLVLVDLAEQIARYEAHEEVQDLLTASVGLNLGVDFLPGAFGYDGRRPPAAELAARILWLDAMTANVDRTWANPNLLVWHRETWAIDHGAALYFQHGWPSRAPDPARFADQPFDASGHVLREVAADPRALHDELAATTRAHLPTVLDLAPDAWLEPTAELPDAGAVRAAYLEHVQARLERPDRWLPAVTR
ncbi:MAG TPA: aminotransferase class I and II [Dermatophilaceae bacterium]|nr:aminotransferase class I and II [Dermatophilaceae bacterium]